MRSIYILRLFAMLFLFAPLSVPAYAETGAERQKECNAQWKQHKTDHGTPKKGEGRDAYNAFRKECTAKRKTENK